MKGLSMSHEIYFIVNTIVTLILWTIPAVTIAVRASFEVDINKRSWTIPWPLRALLDEILSDFDGASPVTIGIIIALSLLGSLFMGPLTIGFYIVMGLYKVAQWAWPKFLSKVFLSKEERAQIAVGTIKEKSNE